MTLTRSSTDAGATADRPRRNGRGLLRAALIRQEATLILVVLVIAVLAGIKNPSFWQADNLLEVLRGSVIYFVMACGAALLVIGGGLDFPVGAVFTLGALITGVLLTHGWPWPFAIIIGLLAGSVVGAINHLIISYWHVPPIIATLGIFFMLTGLDNVITGGNDVLPLPQSFQNL